MLRFPTRYDDMTAMTLPPWSFSMIEMFENCPRKAFHKYILKEKEPESPAMAEGNRLDKAIEARIMKGKPLPPEFVQYDPMAETIARLTKGDYTVTPQHKIGITRDFRYCDFWDKKVWGRGALDVSIIGKKARSSIITSSDVTGWADVQYSPASTLKAVIADWKTGKNSDGKAWSNHGLQLKIFTLLLFKLYPGLDEVTAFNIWLKDNKIGTVYKWDRSHEAILWREVLPRVMAVEKAFAEQRWPLTPGPLCSYCPVKQCEFNRS